MQQFIFNLKEDENYKSEDYITCKSNSAIISYLNKWPNWNSKIIIIYGDMKSGKTHLSHIWHNISNAKFISYNDIYLNKINEIIINHNCFIIDDIENFLTIETNFLHFINTIIEQKKYLLITSKNHPKDLSIKLPDLKSRISSFLEFNIPKIDEELFKLITFKYFTNKHLVVNDKIINYMLNRVDRSFISLKEIVHMIDKKALVEKRSISISLIRQIIENI